MRTAIAGIEQYNRNSALANNQLAITSSTLNGVVNALQKVRALAFRAANEALNNEALLGMASQLDGFTQELYGLANTQHLGNYIFSGTLTDTPPIVANVAGPPPYIYQGNADQMMVQVAPGITTAVSVTGDKVFNMGGAGVPTAPDVFTIIQMLRDDVLAGNIGAISALIEDIDEVLHNAVGIEAQVGAWLRRVEAGTEALFDAKVRTMTILSETEDVDMAEAIVELRTRENVYQAAVSVAGRVLQTTLANFLN
jgi:flagellar hook-associated protein 3 FlgL